MADNNENKEERNLPISYQAVNPIRYTIGKGARLWVLGKLQQKKFKAVAELFFDKIGDGQRWLRAQEINLANHLRGKNPDMDDRILMVRDVLNGSQPSDAEADYTATRSMSKLKAVQEGMPVRTGIDIDWEAVGDAMHNPEGVLEVAATAGLALAGILRVRPPIAAHLMTKYLHTDNRTWLMRQISGGSKAYDEEAIGGDAIHLARSNDGLEWDPGSFSIVRAVAGEAAYQSMHTDKVAKVFATIWDIMSGFSMAGSGPNANPFNHPNAGQYLSPTIVPAAGELLFNDPMSLIDTVDESVKFVKAARKPATKMTKVGGKIVEEWSSSVRHLAHPEELKDYQKYRATVFDEMIEKQGLDVDKMTSEEINKFETELDMPSFVDWRRNEYMRGIDTEVRVNVNDTPSLRKKRDAFLAAVDRGAPLDELRTLRKEWTQHQRELQQQFMVARMPYAAEHQEMENMVRTLSQDQVILRQMLAQGGDLPDNVQFIHSFLNRYSYEYKNALGQGDVKRQTELMQDMRDRINGLVSRDLMSDEPHVLRKLEETEAMARKFSGQIEQYNRVKEHLAARFPGKTSHEHMRTIFAEIAANRQRSDEGYERMIASDGLLVDPWKDLLSVRVDQLNEHTLSGLANRADVKEILENEAANRIPSSGGLGDLDPRALLKGRTDPYFKNQPLREVALDYSAGEREMVSWAENLQQTHPEALAMLNANFLEASTQRSYRESIGQVLAIQDTHDPRYYEGVLHVDGRPLPMEELQSAVERVNAPVDAQIANFSNKVEKLESEVEALKSAMSKFDVKLHPADTAELHRLTNELDRFNAIKKPTNTDTDNIRLLEAEILSIKTRGIQNGDMYNSPEGKKLTDSLGRGIRQLSDLNVEIVRLQGARKSINQVIQEVYPTASVDPEELLRGVLNHDPTDMELKGITQIRELVHYLWDELIKTDPDIVTQVSAESRDLRNLVGALQTEKILPIGSTVGRNNVFNPKEVLQQGASYDFTGALNYAIHAVNRRKHLMPAIERIDMMRNTARITGQHTVADYYDVMSRRMRGESAPLDQWAQSQWVEGIYQHVKDPNLRDFLLSHRVGDATAIAGGFVRGSYIGNLGANVGFMFKNMTGMINTVGYFDAMPTIKGVVKLLNDPEQVLKRAGLTIDVTDFYGGGLDAKKLTDKAMKANAVTENVLRGTAAYVAMDRTLQDWCKLGLIAEPTYDAVRTAGLGEQLFRQGLDAAFETQHIYGIWGLPVTDKKFDLFGNIITRPFIQFVNYWAKQTSFGLRMASEQEYGKIIKWFATTGHVIRVAEQMGLDASSYAGASYGGPSIDTPAKTIIDGLFAASFGLTENPEKAISTLTEVAEQLAIIGLGSGKGPIPGLPANAMYRAFREGYAGVKGIPIVPDRTGEASAYISSNERWLRAVGLPSMEGKKRNRLFKMGMAVEAEQSIVRCRIKWAVQDMMRDRWDSKLGRPNLSEVEREATFRAIRNISQESGFPMPDHLIENVVNKGIFPDTWNMDFFRDRKYGVEALLDTNREFIRSVTGRSPAATLDQAISPEAFDALSKMDIADTQAMRNVQVHPNQLEIAKNVVATRLQISREHVRIRAYQVEVYNTETDSWELCPPGALAALILQLNRGKSNE